MIFEKMKTQIITIVTEFNDQLLTRLIHKREGLNLLLNEFKAGSYFITVSYENYSQIITLLIEASLNENFINYEK